MLMYCHILQMGHHHLDCEHLFMGSCAKNSFYYRKESMMGCFLLAYFYWPSEICCLSQPTCPGPGDNDVVPRDTYGKVINFP